MHELHAVNLIKNNMETYIMQELNPRLPEHKQFTREGVQALMDDLPYSWDVFHDYVKRYGVHNH
jgi:hypothetical protein